MSPTRELVALLGALSSTAPRIFFELGEGKEEGEKGERSVLPYS